MNSVTQLASIIVLSLVASGGTYLLKGPPDRLLHCDPKTLKADEVCLESIPQGVQVVWVDARPRKDWEKSGVPGSVLWNLDPNEDMQAFEVEVATKVAVASRVVVYCSDENCGVSRQIAARIRALDLGAKVEVLHGGWRALSEAGRVRGSKPNAGNSR